MLDFSCSEEKPRPSIMEFVFVFHSHEGIPFLIVSAVDHCNTVSFVR
jgi:hypothetical protein